MRINVSVCADLFKAVDDRKKIYLLILNCIDIRNAVQYNYII